MLRKKQHKMLVNEEANARHEQQNIEINRTILITC